MNRFASLVICLALALPAMAQTSSTQPASAPATPLLGQLFRSRLAGIQFSPPAGGAIIRDLNTGEIVRFVFADQSWDIRVKPIPLHVPLALSAAPDAGLLELTASQLTDSNPSAVILRKDVAPIHGKDVGRIEATYSMGTDHVFGQQALFRDTDQHYFLLQMTAKASPQDDATARAAFEAMLQTVQILDRHELLTEQKHRLFKTRELWVLLDQKTVSAVLQPLHFMRVVRDNRDVGFIQVNERLAKHNGNNGIEVIVRSRLQPDQQPDPSGSSPIGPAVSSEPTGIVIPKPLGPAVTPTTRQTGPQNIYTFSTYFVTFDRDHEDWTSITQTDDNVAGQLTETAYSDRTYRRKFTPATQPAKGGQPILTEIPKITLDVSYAVGNQKQRPIDTDVPDSPPFYLPQALGQLLPRLLPPDRGQYMFAFYVGSQRNVMSRYVDVGSAREVELDGQTVRAIPIEDRIGVDGIPTTHYISRQGEWLATISEDGRLQVFPTDEHTLKGLWPGFVTSPEPPLEGDTAPGVSPADSSGLKLQNPGSTGR